MAEGLRDERLDDGTLVKNVPAHVTREQLQRMASGEPSPAVFETAPGKQTLERFRGSPFANKLDQWLAERPDILGSTGGEIVRGAADIPVGLFQLGANLTPAGPAVNRRIQGIEEQSQLSSGREPGDISVGRLAGNLMNPIPFKVAPYRAGAKVLERLGTSSLTGGGFGLTAPVESGDEDFASKKAQQVGTGMALGPFLQGGGELISKGARAAYHGVIEPLFERGRNAIKGRELNEAAGNLRQPVMQALEQRHEIVPGSAPTAGEAAAPVGSAEFSGLQARVAPRAATEYERRAVTQDMARTSSVRRVGQDKTTLEAAEKARDVAADIQYGKVAKRQLLTQDIDPVLKGPLGQEALRTAKPLMKEHEMSPYSIEGLQLVREALDSMVNNPQAHGLKGMESKTIIGIKERLTAAMKKQVPEWDTARANFATRSEPINQMKVGQYLEDKLSSALSEFGMNTQQRAALYAQALRDAPGTVKRSLKEQRFTSLDQVLEPAQLQAVEEVAMDLARESGYKRLAARGLPSSEGGMAGKQLSKEIGSERLINPLDRTMMVINAVLKRVQGKMDATLEKELAVDMLSPETTLKLMKAAETTKERQAIIDAIKAGRLPAAGAVTQSTVRE